MYSEIRWNRFGRELDRELAGYNPYADNWRKRVGINWRLTRGTDETDGNAWDFYLAACRELATMPEQESALLSNTVRERTTNEELEAARVIVESRWKISDLFERGANCPNANLPVSPSAGRRDESHPWLREMRAGLRFLFCVGRQRRADRDLIGCLDIIRIEIQIGLDLAAVGYREDTMAAADAVNIALESARDLIQAPGCTSTIAEELDSLLNRTDSYFPSCFRTFDGSRLAQLSDLRREAESNLLSALPLSVEHWRNAGFQRLGIARASAHSAMALWSLRNESVADSELQPWEAAIQGWLPSGAVLTPRERRWWRIESLTESCEFATPCVRAANESDLIHLNIETRLALVRAAAKVRAGRSTFGIESRHWPSNPLTSELVTLEESGDLGTVVCERGYRPKPSALVPRYWNPPQFFGDYALKFPLEHGK